jgi:cobalt/nickel transport system permease protein
LQYARLERWSRGDSAIHRRHAAARIAATLVVLISISTLTMHGSVAKAVASCALSLALLVSLAAAARIPLFAMMLRAAVVLPFALTFALVSAIAGEPARAAMLVVRAYLSAIAALLLIATTPMPELIAGLEWLRMPPFLVQVMQFLYRYLMVLAGEANAMRQASLARAGSVRRLRFGQASAAAGVLFARSWARAESIHQAMISRGFDGHMPAFARKPFGLADAGFVVGAVVLIAGLRIAFR